MASRFVPLLVHWYSYLNDIRRAKTIFSLLSLLSGSHSIALARTSNMRAQAKNMHHREHARVMDDQVFRGSASLNDYCCIIIFSCYGI